MSDRKIYALKVSGDWANAVSDSLRIGVGCFGWSYIENGDLLRLKEQVDKKGWESLSTDERNCFQRFLLNLVKGDWVVYVNVPVWGRCTLARVAGPYYWLRDGKDFNHKFKVDPSTIFEIDRNDVIVEPALSARLKLQGRFWRIYADKEFDALLGAWAHQGPTAPRTPESSAALLAKEITPLLRKITESIQRTHPNYGLEALLELVFRKMPTVQKVTRQGGAGDHGADLIVEYETGLPIPALQTQQTCVVQAKSFVGEHWETRAVEDIRRAFVHYPNADIGLIVSTADASTPALDIAIEELRRESGKRVELLIGADVARFLLRFCDIILM